MLRMEPWTLVLLTDHLLKLFGVVLNQPLHLFLFEAAGLPLDQALFPLLCIIYEVL